MKEKREVYHIRIDYGYNKEHGKLSDALISEMEHIFKEKDVPFKIETIHKGLIIFFHDYIPEIWRFMKSKFMILQNGHFPAKYSKISNSYTNEEFYVESNESLALNIADALKNMAASIDNKEELLKILKKFS